MFKKLKEKLNQLLCPHDWDTWNRKFVGKRQPIDGAPIKYYEYTCNICGKKKIKGYWS